MNMFKEKISVIKEIKKYLDENGFNEVSTPVIRRNAGKLIRRMEICGAFGKKYGALRDSHELQLRWLLTEYDSVYEIGSCFREESADNTMTNAQEFLLMELFTTKHDLSDLMKMTMEIIHLKKPDAEYEIISIADHIRKDLGVDLEHDSQELLFNKLKDRYPKQKYTNDYEYVMYYIEKEIEPLSKGKLVFFTDYPECTCSYANIKKGDVISRFELFADGLELANGFDDECLPLRFRQRNKELPIFDNEENAIAEALESNKLPAHSSGVGIGIERLCMYLYNSKSIQDFLFPSNNF